MTHTTGTPTSGPARRPPLATILFAIVVLVGVSCVAVGYVVFGIYASSQQHRADDLRTTVAQKNAIIAQKDKQLADLLDKYASVVQDCQDAGCTTTAPSPEIIREFIQGTPGPAGAAGRTPTTEEVLAALASYCAAQGGCNGATGAAGAAGAAGSPGATGAQGDPGATGATGAQGQTGADGQPPVDWTYDDALGFEHTCTRTDPFDALAPTYTCS